MLNRNRKKRINKILSDIVLELKAACHAESCERKTECPENRKHRLCKSLLSEETAIIWGIATVIRRNLNKTYPHKRVRALILVPTSKLGIIKVYKGHGEDELMGVIMPCRPPESTLTELLNKRF